MPSREIQHFVESRGSYSGARWTYAKFYYLQFEDIVGVQCWQLQSSNSVNLPKLLVD